ncbi:unnamed protein product [Rhizophagus irregularis]|nr:unnamed protein product [Rhizophagus irregularis]
MRLRLEESNSMITDEKERNIITDMEELCIMDKSERNIIIDIEELNISERNIITDMKKQKCEGEDHVSSVTILVQNIYIKNWCGDILW